MARLRKPLLRLLAALLFLQSGVAMAHCLRSMAGDPALLVEICTAEGMRMLDLGDHDEAKTGSGICAVCADLPAVSLPAPPSVWRPVLYVAPRFEPISSFAAPIARARAPPLGSRAPPAIT
ncbi:DUF2946 family protein [Sabulicella rubraurantiaca]|uniref:DUF2946 family protein n=1 Tax=Sabulicella rubraurantiaca TaxID=2811429 RepID=UPI001A978F2A|nr:DUF2946 family protein [Sabulicella rubraurantiaca]